MGYLSLYRKWRPKNFDDIAGQSIVVRTLKNALTTGRIAHAYLFCGPRGTGKTTSAKVFAKALNCEHGPTTNPCNQCFSCEQINSGRSVDVIEIDAASNRRIDEIRDLRDKVKFAPSEGAYKVYIIDEVHMLTKEAFNALLKTLEEPPANVVFILATTEPHKIIPTIISRCQRFDFGLLSVKDLKARLMYICQQEGVSITDGALTMIARSAEGGARDAISILDQSIAFGGDSVTVEDVNTILGKVDQRMLARVVEVIARKDTEGGIRLINEIVDQGKDMNQFVKDLLFHFRDLMLIKECGVVYAGLELPDELKEDLVNQCQKFSLKDILRILDILSETDQHLKFASQPRLMLEMSMIKLVSPDVDTSITNLISRLARLEELVESGGIISNTLIKEVQAVRADEKRPSTSYKEEQVKPTFAVRNIQEFDTHKEAGHTSSRAEGTELVQSPIHQEVPTSNENIQNETHDQQQASQTPVISMEEIEKYWEVTMTLLNKYNETRKLRAFLLAAKPYTVMGGTLYIVYPKTSTFHKTNAEKEIGLLERALKKVIGHSLKVICIYEGEEPVKTSTSINTDVQEVNTVDTSPDPIEEPQPAYLSRGDIESDPVVQKALKIFGGKIIQIEEE